MIIIKGYSYSNVNNHQRGFQFLNFCISYCSNTLLLSKLLWNLLLLGLTWWPEPQREILSGNEKTDIEVFCQHQSGKFSEKQYLFIWVKTKNRKTLLRKVGQILLEIAWRPKKISTKNPAGFSMHAHRTTAILFELNAIWQYARIEVNEVSLQLILLYSYSQRNYEEVVTWFCNNSVVSRRVARNSQWGGLFGGSGGFAPGCRRLGVWEQSPQPPEAWGSGSGAPSARKFCIFLQK